MKEYESVIGMEVHLQLSTRSKAFCSCEATFGETPNTRVCPVCLGMPGNLPVLNELALRSAMRVALALHCDLNRFSKFDRKNYFYPDLPKGYQISQYDLPVGENGWLEIPGENEPRRIRVRRVHLEEDTGKLIHDDRATESTLDLNRAGIPLVEIVTEPDLRGPQEAYDYLKELRLNLSYLGVSSCDMEKGSLRCEPNLSVREKGSETLGTKTEIKNLNSFRNVKDSVEFEISRQIEVIESGGAIRQETRLWDVDRGVTAPMRAKEEAHDYRYFPEPDIPPIRVQDEQEEELRRSLPEGVPDRRRRFREELLLPASDTETLLQDRAIADYYEEGLATWNEPKALANWILSDLLRELNERRIPLSEFPVPPESLAALGRTVAAGSLSRKMGSRVFREMAETGKPASAIIAEKNLAQISSEEDLLPHIEEALARNPKAVEDLRSGNDRALAALVGFVMKKTAGKANPATVNKLLRERIEG